MGLRVADETDVEWMLQRLRRSGEAADSPSRSASEHPNGSALAERLSGLLVTLDRHTPRPDIVALRDEIAALRAAVESLTAVLFTMARANADPVPPFADGAAPVIVDAPETLGSPLPLRLPER